jgi:DNA-binding beta-propeller fold protein YncE
MAIEPSGQTALVRDANGVYRVNLTVGNASLLASGLGSGGIAIEPGGTSALLPIVLTFEIKRINLQTNELSTVPSQLPGVIRGRAVAAAPDGAFALVAAGGGDAGIAKVNLRTDETIQIFVSGLALFCSHRMGDFLLSEVIFSWSSADGIGNRVSRVHLSDRAFNDITYGISPLALALEGDGSTVLVTSSGCFGSLYRLDIASGAPEFISGAGTIPTDLAILPGGQNALITAERFSTPTGDLFEVELATKQATSIAITPAPQGVVAEPSGSAALITTGDTVSRVTLATGQVSAIASGLISPAGLAMESSGQVAIVGSLSNEVVRVLLTELVPPTVEHIATLTNSARYVAVESGNKTVLVAETGRGLSRINVATKTVTELFADPTVTGKVVIEAGGQTALLATGEGIKRVRIK